MSYATDVLQGVSEALAEVGESVTIERTTQVRDPVNPTRMITTVSVFSAMGALMGPVGRYEPSTQTIRQVTEWYTDLLSVRDSSGTYLNSLTSITWSTKEGDLVRLSSGPTYKMLANEQPRINGVQVAAFHEVSG